MKYILNNMKNFAFKNTLIFVLFIVCEIADVLIILFAHGAFQSYQTSKQLEEMKGYGYYISFGEIEETHYDEEGNIAYYDGSESITPSQLQNVLKLLDDETKSSLPGMYIDLKFEADEALYEEYFGRDDEGEVIIPRSAVRLEFDEELNEYSLYGTYLRNTSISKGRYFTKEEYASSENLVVLPYSAKEELLGQTVHLLGKDYKVIGIKGPKASWEFDVPFKTLDDNCTIREIGFLDDNALDALSFSKLQKAFDEGLDCNTNFPPADTIDFSELKFYNSVMYISVAVAVASAINLAMLFRFVVSSRTKQTAVFQICGCSLNRVRRMYIAEILMISVVVYVVFAVVFNYAVMPWLKMFFEYIEVAYNYKVYLTIFAIYIVSIYLFLNTIIVMTNRKSLVEKLREKVR